MLTIVAALVIGLPLPLLPAQIIWLNLVTDTFLNVALAMEPKEEGLLSGKGLKPARYLLDKVALVRSVLMAVTMAIGTLTLFVLYLDEGMIKALSVSVTVLAVYQWFNALNCRHEVRSVFTMNPFSNVYLLASFAVVVALQLAMLHVPFMQEVMSVTPLNLTEWGIIIVVSLSIIAVEEVRKLIMRMTTAIA
jgi:Ca2+-transporting ATPase